MKTVFFLSKVCYLTMLSVSRLYSVDDKMINEYEAVDGTGIGRRKLNTWRKSAPLPFCPEWEADD
jgi:hypothetical protein